VEAEGEGDLCALVDRSLGSENSFEMAEHLWVSVYRFMKIDQSLCINHPSFPLVST
jgi:hypothetical protein